jgi:hypothetical protein
MIAYINIKMACFCSSSHLVGEGRELVEADLWLVNGLVVVVCDFLKECYSQGALVAVELIKDLAIVARRVGRPTRIFIMGQPSRRLTRNAKM